MLVLAIDTTMNGCCACLYDDKKGELISKTLEMSRGQAEHLMPLIDNIIKTTQIKYSDIDLIAVTRGPGAFTGLRIGLATAKSLALALDTPVVGVSTFNAVLETYKSLENYQSYPYYGVLLETKRGDYYFQIFEGDSGASCCEGLSETAVNILEIINNRECILIGDALDRFQGDISNSALLSFCNILLPSPVAIAKVALLEANNPNDTLSPLYLRMPEIGTPKTLPRKLNILP